MAGRIQECDLAGLPLVLHLHGVGADGLRDAARLAARHLRLPDEVQQRSLQRIGHRAQSGFGHMSEDM